MRRSGLFLAAVLALFTLAVSPRQASAQCTASCACTTRSCECSTVGGKGAGCETDGERCIVLKCGPVLPTQYIVAPNGLLFRTAEYRAAAGAESDEPVPEEGPTVWETVEQGYAVRRNCIGIVVEHWYDSAAAERVREQSRRIEI